MIRLLYRWSSAFAKANRSFTIRQRIGGSKRHDWQWWRQSRRPCGPVVPVLALSWITTLKNLFGTSPIKMDDDPLKHKIKEAWLYRKYGRFTEALSALDDAMKLAKDRNEMAVSRVSDELANVYYQMDRLDEAEQEFKNVLQRLINLHGKKDDDQEFIEVSIKLADIYARKGRIDDAEIGYKHCVSKQMKVVENHMTKFALRSAGNTDIPHIVEEFGSKFTDPLALYGMCLEQYAHFIVMYRDESRAEDSCQLMDEALKISHQVYGMNCFHTINMLNNYGALLIMHNWFELARKYLAIGIDRILYVDECSAILPGYYCNYAEALFHCGERKSAVSYAKKATEFARSESHDVQNYANSFFKNVEKDFRRRK